MTIIVLLCYSFSGQASSQPLDEKKEPSALFQKAASIKIEQLEKNYALFPDEITYKKVKTCKETVRSLLESADTEKKKNVLADLFCKSLSKSEKFRFYDYYVLWMSGSKFLKRANSTTLVVSIANKIDNEKTAKKPLMPYIRMAIDVLLELVEYDNETSIVDRNGEVNWQLWTEFRKHITENKNRFRIDPVTKKLKVSLKKTC